MKNTPCLEAIQVVPQKKDTMPRQIKARDGEVIVVGINGKWEYFISV
jgi:hypothetical protein